MDWMIYLKALLLGILEGLTEFLPISSTGHLIIAEDLLGFTGERAKSFAIFIQLGAILAVCWYYRPKIWNIGRRFPRDPAARGFILNLAVAFMPAAILGLMLRHAIKQYLFHPLTVACALIAGGFIILLIERLVRQPHIQTVDDIRWQDALKVGCAQAFALIPGTSRSGATIMGGLVFGLSRPAATEFSFFLAIPTMFAATGYELIKSWQMLQPSDVGLFGIGFLAAFVSAFVAVKVLLSYIANHDFSVFAYYRLLFGLMALVYFWA
jgi:undecaprenyl-diphosphatase